MLALGNRPRIRQKHFKSSGDRRRRQEARAVYSTRLRFEPLEDRRLLSLMPPGPAWAATPLEQRRQLGRRLPVAGDNLVSLPAQRKRRTSTTSPTRTAFGSIEIAGNNYSLTGNQVSLGGDVTSEGTGNSLGLDLQLAADHGISPTRPAHLHGLRRHRPQQPQPLAKRHQLFGQTEIDGAIGSGDGRSEHRRQRAVGADSGQQLYGRDHGQQRHPGRRKRPGPRRDRGTGTGTDVENDATLQLEGSITVTGELLTSSTYCHHQ